ncbi:MAG TPA: PHP domain-containing protein [Clostridia bacterium]|nr:PHP domain-containing protein [Clostridia bacterium]
MKLFYDFHLHSCLSPCGDNEMTPYNLVNMAKLGGLDIIAVTDHNTCLNCPAAIEAGKKAGITVVAGMELCTSEEVHILCLFSSLDKAMDFSAYVDERLPPLKNRPDIFGDQLIMDEGDRIIGRHERLLMAASSISVSHVVQTVADFDGVCFPAHIDRPSYSVISNLGSITAEMGFGAAELTAKADLADYKKQHPILEKMFIVKGSDAHRLADIGDARHIIDLKRNNAQAVVDFFNKLLGGNCQS